MLGKQHQWPTGESNHDRESHAEPSRRRPHVRVHIGRRCAYLWHNDRGRRVLLGRQRDWPARDRHPRQPGHDPRACCDRRVIASTSANYHSCALTTAGAAICWGRNSSGELGDATTTLRRIPVSVSGGHTFASKRLDRLHTCAVGTGGQARCWGRNSSGELGDGSTVQHATPAPVTGGLSFSAVSAGGFHSCGIAGGTAYCWGRNVEGQFGDGTTVNQRSAPGAVSGALTFNAITAGMLHTCALSAGAAHCWGTNASGQLGDGTITIRRTPVAVAGALTFTSLTAATGLGAHTCGVAVGVPPTAGGAMRRDSLEMERLHSDALQWRSRAGSRSPC